MTAVASIFNAALLADVLDALDAAESVHRAFGMETAATLGLDGDTFRRAAVCASSAYEALCRARQLLEGAA